MTLSGSATVLHGDRADGAGGVPVTSPLGSVTGAADDLSVPHAPPPDPPDAADTRAGFRRWLDESALPWGLAGLAFGGSYFHLVDLVNHYGLHGGLAYVTAAVPDALVAMAARERQRRKRVEATDPEYMRRTPRRTLSLPFAIMIGGTLLSLGGQLTEAPRSVWGWIWAAVPLVGFLLALAIIESRTAETHRRSRAYLAALAEWQQAEDARLAAAERHHARARERQQRYADAQARLHAVNAGAGAAVTPLAHGTVSGSSTPASIAGGAGEQLAIEGTVIGNPTATQIMRAHWDAEVSAGRVPSGADLLRAAGLEATSSLGRQRRARWITELPAEMRAAASAGGA